MVISRTINHDWSYLSSSPIVSNRTLTRTTNRDEWLQMETVGNINDWSYNQSEQLVTGRTTDRATVYNHARLVVRPHAIGGTIMWDDLQVCDLQSQTDRRQFLTWLSTLFDWFCSYDHPRPLKSVARSLYDLTAIPKCFDRNLIAGLVWLWQS